MLLYVHGLNSSPASFKARLLREKLESLGRGEEFSCPRLPNRPGLAIGLLEHEVARFSRQPLALVGSSLGGFYATWLAEKHGLPAVLVNPAVRPHEQLKDFLGTQKNLHTGQEWQLDAAYLADLARFHVPAITRPERYLLLATTGDEVLDYREAVGKYRGARQVVVEGGDHGFSNFADYLDLVLEFGEG
ncbi:MAG: esterase [Betaproteobacteria bacterium]|nr:esterase [Betaproteobacteria bacterium]